MIELQRWWDARKASAHQDGRPLPTFTCIVNVFYTSHFLIYGTSKFYAFINK